MADPKTANISESLRLLPSVDELLATETALKIGAEAGRERVRSLVRNVIDSLRQDMQDGSQIYSSKEEVLAEVRISLKASWTAYRSTKLQKVINATGVIVHTNLGRAPLSDAARKAMIEQAGGYCTLEYDLESGTRGKRGAYTEQLLTQLTGAESALIVNNCAAAAFLVLSVFAKSKEVIVSRGELVEIGGDFRVPDVLVQSGATLREVGTTNRTKLADYEKAVNEDTAMVMRVHPSNYKIVGFTATPTLAELAALTRAKDVLLYEDAGSGAMVDLTEFGLGDEPLISRSVLDGADIITFSGDKLLGGCQAGIIVGKRDLIERIRKHPLYRALRVDKIVYAGLTATLESYSLGNAFAEIPVLRMLSMTAEELAGRTREFAAKLSDVSVLSVEVMGGKSVVGGGAAPAVQPLTTLASILHRTLSASELEQALRSSKPPVIARIENEKVLIDLRTVTESEEEQLLEVLRKAQ
jgi:L-seryl-tRNA(Ser) seleniumtransferase